MCLQHMDIMMTNSFTDSEFMLTFAEEQQNIMRNDTDCIEC